MNRLRHYFSMRFRLPHTNNLESNFKSQIAVPTARGRKITLPNMFNQVATASI